MVVLLVRMLHKEEEIHHHRLLILDKLFDLE